MLQYIPIAENDTNIQAWLYINLQIHGQQFYPASEVWGGTQTLALPRVVNCKSVGVKQFYHISTSYNEGGQQITLYLTILCRSN